MSEVDSQYVKQGFWVNNKEGSPMGSTITANSRTGAIVVALLAVLSSLATNHMWGLVLFLSHQWRARGRPADALFRQQQALLRANPPPTSFFLDWMKIYWTWRKRSSHAFRRCAAHLLLGLSFAVISILAGIFSSYVITATNIPVLVKGPLCGPLNIEPTVSGFSFAYLDDLDVYIDTVKARSIPYAEECYQIITTPPLRCKAFILPRIDLTPRKEDCPFDPSICIKYDKPAVSIDSGLVNTNEIFGWNMQPKDQIKYRRKVTCGILNKQGRTTLINSSDYPFHNRKIIPGEKMSQVSFGYTRGGGAFANATFSTSLAVANISSRYTVGFVRSFSNPVWSAISHFNPMPGLRDNASDLNLISIASNQVSYLNAVDDPFFSAHRAFTWRTPTADDTPTLYFVDDITSVLGCRQQYQFCIARNQSSDYCTDLMPLPGLIQSDSFPGASDIQIAALQLIATSSARFDTASAADAILKVQDLAGSSGSQILSLPDDQWIQEITRWEKYIWASVQTVVSDYAVGYGARAPSAQSYVRTILSPGERELCGAQRMMKSGGFVNINVFGLSFIIGFACLVTILNLLILKLFVLLSQFRRPLAPRIDRWIQDGVFQLQRRAYESSHQGTWKLLNSDIPVTEPPELLQELPLETRCPNCSGAKQRQSCDGVTIELSTIPLQSTQNTTAESADGGSVSEISADDQHEEASPARASRTTSRTESLYSTNQANSSAISHA